jgi:capsule polysaccharide export protein KpsE/RkpR
MSDFDDYNDFENLGSFESVLREYYADEIRVNFDRVSPDYGDVDTLFNEYFRDNI